MFTCSTAEGPVAPAQLGPARTTPRTRVNCKSCGQLRPVAPKKARPCRRSAGGGADPEGGLNHEGDHPLGRKNRIPIHPLRKTHPRNTLLPAIYPRLPQVPVLHRGPDACQTSRPRVGACPGFSSGYIGIPAPVRTKYASTHEHPTRPSQTCARLHPKPRLKRSNAGTCAFLHPRPQRPLTCSTASKIRRRGLYPLAPKAPGATGSLPASAACPSPPELQEVAPQTRSQGPHAALPLEVAPNCTPSIRTQIYRPLRGFLAQRASPGSLLSTVLPCYFLAQRAPAGGPSVNS